VKILVVDIGGTNVKVWRTGETDCEKFSSGKRLKPQRFVDMTKELAGDWAFDRVSIGFPGEVRNGRPASEPFNLGTGWVDFDWSSAFTCPLRIMNDACMQALGSYEGGKMLYLGLGTGVGTAFITEGVVVALALGHLLVRGRKSCDELLNRKALKEQGASRWSKVAFEAGELFKAAFFAEYVVFGGGNARKLGKLPEGFRRGGNHNAYFGGLRMWDDGELAHLPHAVSPSSRRGG
jgi:predicted NBD/HSP70 family sugar kinase